MPAQAIVVSFVVSLASLLLLLKYGRALVLDRPNERSLHERPVPRTGGIAIAIGVAAAAFLWTELLWPALAAAIFLGLLSLRDDLAGLPTLARLSAHLGAAAVALWYWLWPIDLWALALLVVAVVWITNLFNFMDGSDGLAGGMAVIGFGAYALAAQFTGAAPFAALCASVASACAAFLLFNFPPARIFMGDVGSIPLGFLAGALGVLGWRDDLWPLWFPLLAFAPFIADATFTLLRRVARRERIWRAHREHYYQRMVRMGLGHRATAWIGYCVMLACAAAALFGRAQPPALQAAVFAAASVFLAGLAVWVDLRWARFLRGAQKAA
jgi:UDP-N-acetylmuramyl pentapeptide phosphotransferase/UDP-N-acetylglucosamine-1-phosphate transferase